MKKVIVALGTLFLLVGCSSEYKTHMKKGEVAFDNKKYEEAMKEYGAAMKIKPEENDAAMEFVNAKDALFAEVVKKAKDLKSKSKYTDAKDKYNEALKLYANRKSELAKDIKEVEQKIAEQKNIKDYEVWVVETTKKYQALVQLWRGESTQASVGARTKEQIAQTLLQVLQTSDQLMKEIENHSIGLNPKIAEMHEQYYSQGNEVYNSARDILLQVNDPTVLVKDLVENGKDIEDHIKAQLSYPVELEKYKRSNSL
ncbi:hypothetical protein [Bacillus bombysepticus]|uniref:hypothetical protein n=1 Tax=Bacillus bombysepticus TaxID=658666 RepID=UPI00301649A3